MNDLRFAFRQLLKNPGFTAVAVLALALGVGGNTPAWAHPGSGIVVDRRGQVFFTDTGQGVWKVDEQGRLSSHEGPAYHWMAIDHDGSLARTRWPASREPSTDIQRVGTDPTLLLSSDFPLTTGPDGNLYYPELGEDDLLRVYRLTPSGERRVLATLATASDGQPLKWLNGMVAGPDGVIYFSENSAVRRITPQGEVSTLASNIMVDDCQPPPGASPRLGPFLRGLDVASDGSVYVAANGCCTLLKIALQGQVTPVLHAGSPWSPTGVAVHGDAVFVLEYLHTASGDRLEWTPRVRKLSPDGTATVVATVERTPGGGSRPVSVPEANTFENAKAGDEKEVRGIRLCWCPPGRFLGNRCRVIRRTSASPTLEDPTGRLGPRPSGSEATRPMRGGCTTCTATSSSGVAIGIMRGCPAELILICARRKESPTAMAPTRGSAGAERGWTRRHSAVPRFDCDTNHRAARTTSASESSLSKPADGKQRTPDH